MIQNFIKPHRVRSQFTVSLHTYICTTLKNILEYQYDEFTVYSEYWGSLHYLWIYNYLKKHAYVIYGCPPSQHLRTHFACQNCLLPFELYCLLITFRLNFINDPISCGMNYILKYLFLFFALKTKCWWRLFSDQTKEFIQIFTHSGQLNDCKFTISYTVVEK